MAIDRADILRLLEALNEELAHVDVVGELYLVGGAVLCLVHQARQSTQDLDGFFRPVAEVRVAAQRVAEREGFPANWLNDAVKGYLSDAGEYEPFLELSNLIVMTARPEYLLAMKCMAMRLGAEFQDERDIRYLLRYLDIDDYATALETISRYYPANHLPQKTLYALEEILGPQ